MFEDIGDMIGRRTSYSEGWHVGPLPLAQRTVGTREGHSLPRERAPRPKRLLGARLLTRSSVIVQVCKAEGGTPSASV